VIQCQLNSIALRLAKKPNSKFTMASFSFGNAAPAQGGGGGNFSFNAPAQQQAPQQQQQQGGGGNKFKLILVGKLNIPPFYKSLFFYLSSNEGVFLSSN